MQLTRFLALGSFLLIVAQPTWLEGLGGKEGTIQGCSFPSR